MVPFKPAFVRSEETQKQTYFHERKSKCMSMRRHRASLFVEQSVFLPGRPKKKTTNKNKINSSQIKLMTFSRLLNKIKMEFQTDGITTFYTRPPPHSPDSSDSIYIYKLYLP